jgi:hypothetical protein
MQSALRGRNTFYCQETSMYRIALSLLVLTGAVIVTGMTREPATVAAATPVAVAEPFWRCPSGFAFETSGSSVHCKKAGWTETKPLIACLVPTPDLKIDLVGTVDMCSGGIGIAVTAEPLCNPVDMANGFTKRKVSGRDYCGKYHPSEIMAPNTMISI